MGFHLVSMLQQQLQELEQLANGANVYHDDSAATKAAKKDLADKKAEGSFYHSDRT